MGVVRFQRLDDDLTLALDGIDHEGALATAFGFHEEGNAFHRVCLAATEVQDPAYVHQRAEGVADRDQALVGAEGVDVLRFRLQGLDDRGERNDECLAGDRDHHAVEDGERQRKAHGEGRALSGARGDRDATAECLDGALDDVHADAAAGDVGDLVGRGEARHEDQVIDFLVCQVGIGRDQIVVDRLLADTLAIDTGTVKAIE